MIGDRLNHLRDEDIEEEKFQAKRIPKKVTNIVRALRDGGKKASNVGVVIVQLRTLPPTIAPVPSISIGIDI